MPMTTVVPVEIETKARVTKAMLPSVNVSICGRWVWVSGNTLEHSRTLLGLGFKYSRQKAKWYFGQMNFPRRRSGIPWAQIVTRYGQADVVPANA